jgi:hypothetical protein
MATRKRKPVRKPTADKTADALPYTAAERTIFYFCDHGKQCHCKRGEAKCRRIDPMAALVRLLSEGEDALNVDMALIQMPLPAEAAVKAYPESIMRIDAVVRKIFDVPAFDDTYGLTTTECVSLLYAFINFTVECKKKAEQQQSSQPPTAPRPFPSHLYATKPSSDSGSTATASSLSSLRPLPPESLFPSEATPESPSGPTSLTA